MSKFTDIGVDKTGHVGTIEIRPVMEIEGLPAG